MSVVDQILTQLERERDAIKAGNFELLSALSRTTAGLFSELSAIDINANDLARLKARADYNRSLMEAAQRGLGAALKQIGTAKDAVNPQTYGPRGERDTLGPRAARLEKRC